jgi:hypothetical protein
LFRSGKKTTQGLIDLKLKKELFSIEPAELIDWQIRFNRPQTKKGVIQH